MPVIDKNKSISFTQSPEQLSNLLKKVKDLTSIDPRIVIRIEPESVLIFSFVGQSFKDIHAFKNYIFPIEEVMTLKKAEIEEPIFFIAKDGKRFFRSVESFLNYPQDIRCKMSINDENYVNYIGFDNTKDNKGLDAKVIGSDPIAIGSQIGVDDINYLMDISKSNFNFRLSKADFAQIKKQSLIENEPKSVLYINIQDKLLSIGETKWHYNITEIDQEDIMLSFPKAYFNTINPSEFIDVYVFDEFILCKYDDYNLMIILETTI